MRHNAQVVCKMIEQMDEHLRTELLKKDGEVQEEKLWEKNFIRLQIEKRKNGDSFDVKDHIRAMVYSMFSGGQSWDKYAGETDSCTGAITSVDTIFHDYEPKLLLKCSAKGLYEELKKIHLHSRFGLASIQALLTVNIPKLEKWEESEGIDQYYRTYIQQGIDEKLPIPEKILIQALSAPGSKDKLKGLGVPLVCEYLRNVGYNLPKPDGHLRRILGNEILGFSDAREPGEYQTIDLVFKIAAAAKKSAAETDYILWAYCSDGHGEICTSSNPKCNICVAAGLCKKYKGDIVTRVKNDYVLDSIYNIKEQDTVSEIIHKAASASYSALYRKILQENALPEAECILEGDPMPEAERKRLGLEGSKLLADRIPELLESTAQNVFDERHNRICEDITDACHHKLGYGIVQRWLNDTLVNLIVIESSLPVRMVAVMRARKYFHVSIGKDILQSGMQTYIC